MLRNLYHNKVKQHFVSEKYCLDVFGQKNMDPSPHTQALKNTIITLW